MKSISNHVAVLILGAGLALAACAPSSTGGPSDSDEVNIGVNNQLGNAISVVLQVGSRTHSAFTVPNGGYVTGEYGGASDLVNVTITVTSLGTIAAPPAKTCKAKQTIIGSSEYGQFDVGAGGINCNDPNTWQ